MYVALNVTKFVKKKGWWGRMYTGITYNSMDSKGRVILPQKFREELGESFYITNGFNNQFRCLQIMDCNEFDRLRKQIRELPVAKAIKIQHILVAPATEVSPNSQGRIQIPQPLREGAGFTKDIVVVGMDTRIEIWDRETYNAFIAQTMEESFEDTLELMRL